MAKFIAPAVSGDPSAVHLQLENKLEMEAIDDQSRIWIYLKGCAGCLPGAWVTFDELGATTLLVANAIGPVAVAGGATGAGQYGWFCVRARAGVLARLAANCAAPAKLGYELTPGVAGDGRQPRDGILGAVSRTATGGAITLGVVQIVDPSVNDTT